MENLLGIVLFILGLCCGSFVNMLIYRTAVSYGLEDKKFKVKNKNRSFCDYCGQQLKWYENIPVFSWVIQGGKTRCCNKKLPLAYPVVELLTGLLFLIYGFVGAYGNTPLQIILGFMVLVLLVFSVVFDWKYMILPDFSTLILVVIAFVGVVFDEKNIIPYLLSALISGGFLLLLNLITKGKGMGMGDVKLAVFMGLFLGYPKIILGFYLAFIIGAMFGLVLILFKKAGRKTQVPFGPFMILGTVIMWWWGDIITEFVMSFF